MKTWYYLLRWMVLVLLGLAIYGQTFGFDFVFDDFQFIVNNPCIQGFDRVHYVLKEFPATRIVVFFSFALNYSVGQLHPAGYHILNFVIHLLATCLVWALAALLFDLAGWTGRELPFFIALLFLVHPCQTQAVSYISQRFESLAAVFYLGSIYFYIRGRMAALKRTPPNPLFKKRGGIMFACSAGLAVLGILTKETVVTVPLMVLAVEFVLFPFLNFPYPPLYKKEGGTREVILPLIILGGVFVLLFLKMVGTGFIDKYVRFSAPSASHDGDIVTGGKYVLTQLRVFLTFIRLLVLPINQNVDYDYPLSTGLLEPPLTLVGLGVIGFIVVLIFRLRRKWPLIAFGLAWILITFSINTAPRTNVIFEHKLYLISFGFFLSLVCGLSALIKDRKILFGILVVLIAVLSLVSYKRNQVWKNELTLWDDVVAKSPHKSRPHYNRGFVYFHQGNFIKALPDFNEAIALNPNYVAAYINRGLIYDQAGLLPQALSDYGKSIALYPNNAEAYYDRGNVYMKQNNLPQALSDYDRAIALNPHYTEAYGNRGSIFVREGDFSKALSDYNKAIALYRPSDFPTDIYIWLNGTKTPSVGEVFKTRYTSYADAYYNRGFVYGTLGRYAQAMDDYTKAIEINPGYANAYNNRGEIYSRQGQWKLAIADFDRAIEINPRVAGYYYNRNACYAKQGKYFGNSP